MKELTSTLLEAQRSESVEPYVQLTLTPFIEEGWTTIDTCDSRWSILGHCTVNIEPGQVNECNKFAYSDWYVLDTCEEGWQVKSYFTLSYPAGVTGNCLYAYKSSALFSSNRRAYHNLSYDLSGIPGIRMWVKNNSYYYFEMYSGPDCTGTRVFSESVGDHSSWYQKEFTTIPKEQINSIAIYRYTNSTSRYWIDEIKLLLYTKQPAGNIACHNETRDLSYFNKLKFWVKVPAVLNGHLYLKFFSESNMKGTPLGSFKIQPDTTDWKQITIDSFSISDPVGSWGIYTDTDFTSTDPFYIDEIEGYCSTTINSYIFATDDTNNRILSVNQKEQPDGGMAVIIFRNEDGYFNDKNLLGYQVKIDWGAVTSKGNEYETGPYVWVITQSDMSEEGKATTQLQCIDNLQRLKIKTVGDITKVGAALTKRIGRKTIINDIKDLWYNSYFHLVNKADDVYIKGTDSTVDNRCLINPEVNISLLALQDDLLDATYSVCKLVEDKVCIKYIDTTQTTEDYAYDGDHCFYTASYGRSLAIPNRLIVCDRYPQPGTGDWHVQAENVDSQTRIGIITRYITTERRSQASNIAAGTLSKIQLLGMPYKLSAPMNVGQEMYDLIKVDDKRTNKVAYARVSSILRIFEPGYYRIALILGGMIAVKSQSTQHYIDSNIGRNFKGWAIDLPRWIHDPVRGWIETGMKILYRISNEWNSFLFLPLLGAMLACFM